MIDASFRRAFDGRVTIPSVLPEQSMVFRWNIRGCSFYPPFVVFYDFRKRNLRIESVTFQWSLSSSRKFMIYDLFRIVGELKCQMWISSTYWVAKFRCAWVNPEIPARASLLWNVCWNPRKGLYISVKITDFLWMLNIFGDISMKSIEF